MNKVISEYENKQLSDAEKKNNIALITEKKNKELEGKIIKIENELKEKE